jgi:hypothetical protein
MCPQSLMCNYGRVVGTELERGEKQGFVHCLKRVTVSVTIEYKIKIVNSYERSPMTICEEFLYGITTVGEGNLLR